MRMPNTAQSSYAYEAPFSVPLVLNALYCIVLMGCCVQLLRGVTGAIATRAHRHQSVFLTASALAR